MPDAPLEFPCDYPVKVMGRRSPEFRAAVLAVLAPPGGPAPELRIEERPSRDGTYVALTCTLRIESRAELDLVYRRLHATGLVLYAL
jgi:putative lipoic acid-binding regulatory protein